MYEQKIKTILQNKITLLERLKGHMNRQVKAIDEDDEPGLIQILDDKETVIEALVRDGKELEKSVALLDEKNRVAIAKKFSELGNQIETETAKITEMENECEKKLMNERQGLFEKMKLLKNGRTLLKGYGMSTRIKPKIKGSI